MGRGMPRPYNICDSEQEVLTAAEEVMPTDGARHATTVQSLLPPPHPVSPHFTLSANHSNHTFIIMSDGNYNRNLLPYRQYQSGLKAGRAQMHTLAIRAFRQWLTEQGYTEAQLHEAELHYRQLLEEITPQ